MFDVGMVALISPASLRADWLGTPHGLLSLDSSDRILIGPFWWSGHSLDDVAVGDSLLPGNQVLTNCLLNT